MLIPNMDFFWGQNMRLFGRRRLEMIGQQRANLENEDCGLVGRTSEQHPLTLFIAPSHDYK